MWYGRLKLLSVLPLPLDLLALSFSMGYLFLLDGAMTLLLLIELPLAIKGGTAVERLVIHSF